MESQWESTLDWKWHPKGRRSVYNGLFQKSWGVLWGIYVLEIARRPEKLRKSPNHQKCIALMDPAGGKEAHKGPTRKPQANYIGV